VRDSLLIATTSGTTTGPHSSNNPSIVALLGLATTASEDSLVTALSRSRSYCPRPSYDGLESRCSLSLGNSLPAAPSRCRS
jgi:hypothetical protein